MASSNGRVFFDPLSRPDSEESSAQLALDAGGSYLLYVYQQQVRASEDFGNPNIDLSFTVPAINDLIQNAEFSPTHCVLNFEAGFTSAILRLGKGNPPGSDDGSEDVNVRDNMVALMDAVKAANPGVKFAYYQIPGHRTDFIAGTTVYDVVSNPNTVFDAGGQSLTGADWMQSRFEERWNANQPIIEASDFLAPSAYDKYPFNEIGSTTRGNINNVGADDATLLSRRQVHDGWGLNEHVAVRKDLVMGMCQYMRQQMGRPFMPIVPFVNQYYQPKGNIREPNDYYMPLYVSLDDYIEKQIRPFMDGGATSIIQWGSDQFFGGKPFDPTIVVDSSEAFQDSHDPWREVAVWEFPGVFGFEEPVDRINNWRNVEWCPNDSPNAELRDALRIAMRDRRLEYIRRASQFVKTYGAARASTLAALA